MGRKRTQNKEISEGSFASSLSTPTMNKNKEEEINMNGNNVSRNENLFQNYDYKDFF